MPEPKDPIIQDLGNKNEPPDAAAWGQLRSFLARQGMSQAQINAAVGSNVGGRSRDTIADSLATWQKGRPKG